MYNLLIFYWVGVWGLFWGGGHLQPCGLVGGSFNLFMATTGDISIIPSFRIRDYMLHVEHVSCVIANCGQHQWVIPSPLSIALKALQEENTTRKLLSLFLRLVLQNFLFQVALLIFFSIAIIAPYFLLVGLLLQSVTLFQSRELLEFVESL